MVIVIMRTMQSVWRIIVKHLSGSISYLYILRVLQFQFLVVPPRILHSTPDQWITQGSSVPLYCNATGDPQPTLYWSKNTSPLTQTMNRSSVMTLNITGKQSEGQYCCVAESEAGTDTACTFIKVTGTLIVV